MREQDENWEDDQDVARRGDGEIVKKNQHPADGEVERVAWSQDKWPHQQRRCANDDGNQRAAVLHHALIGREMPDPIPVGGDRLKRPAQKQTPALSLCGQKMQRIVEAVEVD